MSAATEARDDPVLYVHRTRHMALLATLLVLGVVAAAPSLFLTHYAVRSYAGLLLLTFLGAGVMGGLALWRNSRRALIEGHAPGRTGTPYFPAPMGADVAVGVLAGCAGALAFVIGGLTLSAVIRCSRDGLANATNLADYVYGEPLCNASLVDLMRRRPYLSTDLDSFTICQDDLGITIAFLSVVGALALVHIVVVVHAVLMRGDTARLVHLDKGVPAATVARGMPPLDTHTRGTMAAATATRS